MWWINEMNESDDWMRWMNEKNEWDEWDEMKEWDESLWWKLKFIIVIKVHLDDENSSLWWRLIMSAEIHHNDADNWTEWWKMILQMKIYHSDENMMGIYHWNSSKKIEILDLHNYLIHFALQCLAWFGLFDTFPRWVVLKLEFHSRFDKKYFARNHFRFVIFSLF